MKNKTFKYVIIFIMFLALGISIGYIGTNKYMDKKEEENKNKEPEVVDTTIDITDDEDQQELIATLQSILNNDPVFYSSKGISVETMDNSTKLYLIYTYIVENNLGTSEQLQDEYYWATTCAHGFINDVTNDGTIPTTCTVLRIKQAVFKEVDKKLFNDDVVDTSVPFTPRLSINCIVDGDSYLCGNVSDPYAVTGALESKFEIQKVLKEEDGTIHIYEKGYLNDKRSSVNDPYDQYDNYYLHSSDSTDYYYELKSADNLTFMHTFKTSDRQNYYYVSTELVEE